MILESSTKQYTTSSRQSWCVQNLNTSPCPSSQRQSSIGVLIIYHIAGSDPLSFLRYCGGGLSGSIHFSPL